MCRFHLQSVQSIEGLKTSLTNTFKSSYLETQRENVNVNKIIRDPKNAEMIKSIYDFRCQVCRIRLDTPYKRPIAIGAHIKGLGTPHNGPDNIENMLCLCPNHHDQLDKYSYSINPLDHSIIGLKEYQNQKLGSYILSSAIKESFFKKIKRVWVHTCSLDHKNALDNYLSRGMKIFKKENIVI